MSTSRFVRAFALSVAIVLVYAPVARAGASHRDCREPMVFDGAAANVVVLPYTYTGGDPALQELGTRLSLLVKLDVLFHILDYGSVGAVQLEMPNGVSKNDPSCEPERVLSKLLGTTQGQTVALRPHRGLVLVWGLIFKEGDDIFVQTYARFLRRDTEETIVIQTVGFSFVAKPTSQLLAFTPQKFTARDLEQIEVSYQRADYVHSEPNEQSPSDRLLQLVGKCYGSGCDDSSVHGAFYVLEKRGEWIRIQYMDASHVGPRKEGWIHAAGGLSGVPLDKYLPELNFIEGCVGYLRLRVADSDHVPAPDGLPALTNQQFDSFVSSNEQRDDVTNAVALQMAGAVQYLSSQNRIEALSKSAALFERAREIVPYDSNAITLAVGAKTAEEFRQRGQIEQTATKAQRLSTAAALVADKTAYSNLSNFYSLLQKMPDSTNTPGNLSREEIRERINNLSRITLSLQ